MGPGSVVVAEPGSNVGRSEGRRWERGISQTVVVSSVPSRKFLHSVKVSEENCKVTSVL